MRVLQLGKFYPPHYGGIQEVMYNLTEGLNNSGIKCDVLCSNISNEYKEEIINNYKVYRTASYGIVASTSLSPQMIVKLRKIIDSYDIIHIHFPDPMANIALMLSNHKNKKIVLHWHSDIVKQKYLLKLYLPFQKWLLNRSDKIIATTPKYIEGSAYLQKYKNKCEWVPIGIEENKFKVNYENVKKIKEKYKNKKIIYSLGRLIYYKGFEYLIKSAKYLNDDYIILIGGEGELENKLKETINKNGLENRVVLLGKIPFNELGDYYKACDIFCLPSVEKSEAFGIVQIEAMSFGKPVVATKIKGSGVEWVNKDGFSGINVEPADPKALADAFKEVLKNYDFFSLNAKKRFQNCFTRDKMIQKVIKIYKGL